MKQLSGDNYLNARDAETRGYGIRGRAALGVSVGVSQNSCLKKPSKSHNLHS